MIPFVFSFLVILVCIYMQPRSYTIALLCLIQAPMVTAQDMADLLHECGHDVHVNNVPVGDQDRVNPRDVKSRAK